MALKILIQAEDMPDGKNKLESYAYAKWKRAPTFRNRAVQTLIVRLECFMMDGPEKEEENESDRL